MDRIEEEVKEKLEDRFYFQKGWRTPIYIIGCLGIISVLFWIIRIATFIIREDKNEKFFGEFFHKLIYYFGFLNITLFIIGFIMGALGIWTW